ncbi:MAG: NADH-quinone oxidoreductase subunit NuoE [Sphingomonadales bacterium]
MNKQMETAGNGVAEPECFEFTAENKARAEAIIGKYPEGRQESAVMPLLDLAQRQYGWLPRAAIHHIGDFLGMPYIRVHEVATFYSMYRLKAGGRHQVKVCTTTPCWLRGSDQIVSACREELGIELGETTRDGEFSLGEVECLGACVNAPVVQIDDDYYEDLDADSVKRILEALKRGETPREGSQTGRQTSCPSGDPTTLKKMFGGKAMSGGA